MALVIAHKAEQIPRVNVHDVMATGQIQQRGIHSFLQDVCCCFSQKRQGLFARNRRQCRQIMVDDDHGDIMAARVVKDPRPVARHNYFS